MTRRYKATGTIEFSVDYITGESVEDAKARFEEPWIEGELEAAQEQGTFKVASLEIKDLGPFEDLEFDEE